MSELKAFRIIQGACEVYDRFEADNVIAEKDAEIVELKKQVHDYTLGLFVIQATAEKEARHHKYKRCEAMAKWCEAKVYNIRRKPLCDMDDHEGWQHDDEFWQRWHKRWLELAEHFRDRTKMMEAK